MPLNITPLREGDVFNAASLNNLVSAVTAALNDVETTDLADEAFTEKHLPDLSFTAYFPNGYSAVCPFTIGSIDPDYGSGTRDNYETGLDTSGGAGTVNYQTFSSNQAGTPPYGPTSAPAGADADEGWAIPAYGGNTSYAAEVAMASGIDLATAGQPNYLLVRGGVSVWTATGAYDSITGGGDHTVTAIAVGWEDDLGNRYIDEASIRTIPVDHYGMPVETFAIINATKVATGNGEIRKAFIAVTCIHTGGNDPASSVGEKYDIYLDYYHVTVTPILAGSL